MIWWSIVFFVWVFLLVAMPLAAMTTGYLIKEHEAKLEPDKSELTWFIGSIVIWLMQLFLGLVLIFL